MNRYLLAVAILCAWTAGSLDVAHATEICGDMDGNGSVSAPDSLRLLRFAVGQSVTIECPQAAGLLCWDTDGDMVCDDDEDVDGDESCTVLDCRGPKGESGVVRIKSLNGLLGTLPAEVEGHSFAGPTVSVTTTETQRVTASASAALGMTAEATDEFEPGLCIQPAAGGEILNFVVGEYILAEIDNGPRRVFTISASVIPGAGTWRVGFCVGYLVHAFDRNDYVNGWVMVTEACPSGQFAYKNACWILGAAGQSCDAACAAEDAVYDESTAIAGSSGGGGDCLAVLDGIGAAGGDVQDASCSNGAGCGVDISAEPVRRRCTEPATEAAASSAGVQRACACQ